MLSFIKSTYSLPKTSEIEFVNFSRNIHLKLGGGYDWAGQNRVIDWLLWRSIPDHLVSIDNVGDFVPTGSKSK